jgi:hypothetical protein
MNVTATGISTADRTSGRCANSRTAAMQMRTKPMVSA